MEIGCPVAALGSEMPRQAPEVRRAATRRIKEMIDVVARQSPDWGQPGAHEHALVTVATMVGALVLARAVDDPQAFRRAAQCGAETPRPTTADITVDRFVGFKLSTNMMSIINSSTLKASHHEHTMDPSRSLRAPPQASAKPRPSASRRLATRSTAPADAARKRASERSRCCPST